MNFPLTRHLQRYEYVIQKGYCYNKVIADIGCGLNPLGSYLMCNDSKLVYAVDLLVNKIGLNSNVVLVNDSLFNFVGKVDTVVAIEVFEHMPKPSEFIEHLSNICSNAFITTPLVEFTHCSRNKDHIAEYSSTDFDRIVEEHFSIVDKVYQFSDMSLCDMGVPNGDSLDTGHVVQMVWCKSKNRS